MLLEELYLERVGAMKGGGLEEADQTIHEIKLLTSSVSSADNALVIDASWQVIGTVGHAEHLHVRGNTYSADLTVAPVGDAWKITGFELLDVNRDAAGETFLAPQTN
jgi:formylmethanofuran dehydrogenase subunit A